MADDAAQGGHPRDGERAGLPADGRLLNRLIRVKEEVNKDAILAEPETVANIKGISITQREEFIVIPFETALESVSNGETARPGKGGLPAVVRRY